MTMTAHSIRTAGLLFFLVAAVVLPTGCATHTGRGTVAGTGIGAITGRAIAGKGHKTKGTLIGAAVGAGMGHVIGKKVDKDLAEAYNAKTPPTSYAHGEVGALGGTKWVVVSIAPKNVAPKYVSMIIDFDKRGRVTTTTTNPDGSVDVVHEHYRVVGSTLIVNRPGYLINAKFGIEGGQLIVDADRFRAVLKRIG